MSMSTNRRGLLRGLLAALLGTAAAPAGAAEAHPEPPPRCGHYYDGVLWCRWRPGQIGRCFRDAEGCPFCRAEELAKQHPPVQAPARPHITTCVYDASQPPLPIPSLCTTTVYDTHGRVVATYDYPAGQPPSA